MHQSHIYAGRGVKSRFIEDAQRRAEMHVYDGRGRLLGEARLNQQGWARSLACLAVSRLDHLPAGLGEWMGQLRAEVPS